MAIASEGFPLYFDCANENGLAVAGLNFPGYAYFPDDARPGTAAVAPYEFPLWVTSNFDNVDDVEAALANITLVNKGFGDFPSPCCTGSSPTQAAASSWSPRPKACR